MKDHAPHYLAHRLWLPDPKGARPGYCYGQDGVDLWCFAGTTKKDERAVRIVVRPEQLDGVAWRLTEPTYFYNDEKHRLIVHVSAVINDHGVVTLALKAAFDKLARGGKAS